MALDTLERRPRKVVGDRRTGAVAEHVRTIWRQLARRRRRQAIVTAATIRVAAVLAGALPALAVAVLTAPSRLILPEGAVWPIAVGALLAVWLLVLMKTVAQCRG